MKLSFKYVRIPNANKIIWRMMEGGPGEKHEIQIMHHVLVITLLSEEQNQPEKRA